MDTTGDRSLVGSRMTERVKRVVGPAFKRPRLEALVAAAYRLSPRPMRRYVRALAPPPGLYAPDERRRAVRHALSWELFPSAYFQWNVYFGFSDPVLDVLRAFAARSRVIVDVGANVGVYSLVMASVAGAGAVIHAFEPHPVNYRRLVRHRDLNGALGVVCHNVACGADVGTARLFEAAGGDTGKASLHRAGYALVDGGIDVEVVRLDTMASALRWDRLDLVKIDVEGHEPETLIGARGSIERFRPVLCVEVTPPWYRARVASVAAAFDWLPDVGYRFFTIAVPDRPGALLAPLDLGTFLDSDVKSQINILALPAGQDLPFELG